MNTAMKRYTAKFFVATVKQQVEMTNLYNGALEEFGETCEEEAAAHVLDIIAGDPLFESLKNFG